MAALPQPWSLPVTVSLPIVLACGAGAVIVTAAALSGRAARRPDMPARRASRPFPEPLERVLTARSTRAVLPVLGLIATAGGVALLLRGTPVDGSVLLVALTWVALAVGPMYRLVNPVRALAPAGPSVLTGHTGSVPRRTAAAQAPAGGTERHARTTDDPGDGPAMPDHGHHHRHGGHLEPVDHHDDAGTAATAPRADAAAYATAHAAELRYAGAWMVLLCAILLSTRDPRVIAVTVVAHVATHAALARRRPGTLDPLEVLSDLIACLAPVGRDLDGRLAWRNPLVAAAHAAVPRGAVALGGVVVAAGLTHAMVGRVATRVELGDAAPAVVLVATLAIVLVVLRLGVIRPFLASATVPLIAAYGTVAAGRWWPPLDLVVFVALHAVAIAVLHRQAIARHDLRTARAVQFPMRLVVMLSVLTGLTLLWTS